jgi:hypothetical protein
MITGLREIRAYCGRKTLAGFPVEQKASIHKLAGIFRATLATDGLDLNLSQLLTRTLTAAPAELSTQVESLQTACRTGQVELAALFMGEKRDDDSGLRFPLYNLAYRALVEVGRSWDKWEPHAHFIASTSPDFVYRSIVQRIAAGRATPVELKQAGNLAEFLPLIEGGEGKDFFRKYSLRSLSVFSPERLSAGIKNALWQYFLDGVTDLELRLPLLHWDFPLATAVDVLLKAARETESAAGRYLKRNFKTRFIFNVYRGEFYGKKEAAGPGPEAAVAELIRLRTSRGREGDGIFGVDLATPAIFSNPDDVAVAPYEEVFGLAQKAGMLRTAHLGQGWELGVGEMAELNSLSLAAQKLFLNRVGHASILDPAYIGWASSPSAFSERREQVFGEFRQRGIMIETCPATNSLQYDPTILRFTLHPFNSWINEGLADLVALAVDDPWIIPVTLSHIVAKLLISNPEELTFATVKQAASFRGWPYP